MAFRTANAIDLTLRKMCGEIACEPYNYCSEQELTCRPCSNICDVKLPNAQENKCEKHCQDYIHDILKGYKQGENVSDIINTIFWLLVVILLLLIILVALVGGMALRKWHCYFKRRQMRKIEDKKFQQKLSSVQYIVNNNNSLRDENAKSTSSQPLRSTLPSTMTLTTQTDTPCSTNTNRLSASRTLPLSTEEPSEDTTLDYASYVNQALSHSPSNENTLNTPKY